jgi:adenine-specific DNA-methyltransferase
LKSPWIALENHLNYIHRPGGHLTEEEAWGLSILYNSSILDSYFRAINGNTQVSATELRAMPLPDQETIATLGKSAMALEGPLHEIDALVRAFLGVGGPDEIAEGSVAVQTALPEGAWEGTPGG